MGLFKKISDLARANLNDLLQKVEDPKELHQQYLLDMNEQKKRAYDLLIKTMAAIKLAELRLMNQKQYISDILDEAKNLLQNAQEEKAKEVLSKKQILEAELNQFQHEIEREKTYIDDLKKGIEALEEKISQQISASTINRGQTYLEDKKSFDTFERMEEKISHTEEEIKALAELINEGLTKEDKLTIIPGAPFDKHSDPIALEKELLELKKNLKV
jgi:phage shock protein A